MRTFRVERQIERQNIHARFAEEAEILRLALRLDHAAHGRHLNVARGGDAALDGVDLRRIVRTEIGAAGVVGVVRHRAGGRRTAPEVFRRREGLADQRRANRLAAGFDDAAAGLRSESDAADAGDGQWINHAADQRQCAEQDHGWTNMGGHDGILSYTKLKAASSMSISLMPMNGRMMPPTP